MATSTMRIRGRDIADHFAAGTGILGAMKRHCRKGLTILMYHKVLPFEVAHKYPLRNLVIDLVTFRRQMSWLRNNFQITTLGKAMQESGAPGKSSGELPRACVTFDDGYLDNYIHAAPILDSLGIQGTFFVTSGFVEGAPLWFDRAVTTWNENPDGSRVCAREGCPSLGAEVSSIVSFDDWWNFLGALPASNRDAILDAADRPAARDAEVFGAMSPGQLRQLAVDGHEIGSHTESHPLLTRVDEDGLNRELTISREKLSRWTGQAVDSLCYPNGDVNASVVSAARRAGYRWGCVLTRGLVTDKTDRMLLPRRGILAPRVGSMSDIAFESEVVGWRDVLKQFRGRLRSGVSRW